MKQPQLDEFIWGIADDILRDVYVRGKYRDIVLPMTVVRRLDAVLEPAKGEVLAMQERLDRAGIVQQDAALRKASGQAFYNTSKFTLHDLRNRAKTQQLKADFEDYLDGFSPNVQEILDKFKFRNQIPTLAEADILGYLIERFLDNRINLSPNPILNGDGSVKLPGLDNHSMGTIFEELIRRFNEDNNEEAGEHFTPRDVVRLMADLILLPIADDLRSGTYLLHDGACGTGGMLTVAEERLKQLANEHDKEVAIHLYGQESQPETYAITKADLLIKGEGIDAENFRLGSTLSQDGFPGREFDFMLSNPPYGKSWKGDLERMGGKGNIRDPRFVVEHAGDPEYNLTTRSSDGQLMFLADKLARMKQDTPLGSRIAEVHNGSSLFTGDAGQGESNIRRWVIENDWLEAIIALPLNLFYNTGIATYIWVLTNRKPEDRKGQVQLIDATSWFKPLRKNLGKRNRELTAADISRTTETFLAFEGNAHSKIFPNAAFGYHKITVERPRRLSSQFTRKAVEGLRFASGDTAMRRELHDKFGQDLYDRFDSIKKDLEAYLDGSDENDGDEGESKKVTDGQRKKLLNPKTWAGDHRLRDIAARLLEAIGDGPFENHNTFRSLVDEVMKREGIKASAPDKKKIYDAVSWRDEAAPPVIKKVHKLGKAEPDPIYGLYDETMNEQFCVVEYEPDPELRDTEQVPLLEEGGIEAFFKREVLAHVDDAWIDASN